jgi:hypothetical protein
MTPTKKEKEKCTANSMIDLKRKKKKKRCIEMIERCTT